MSIDRSQIPSFFLALHGWEENMSFDSFVPLIDLYFGKAGVEAHIASIKDSSSPTIKIISARTLYRKFKENSIDLISTIEVAHLLDKNDKLSETFAVGFSKIFDDQNAYILNAVSGEAAGNSIAIEFLRDTLEFLTPSYGYSLELPLRDYPIFFSLGLFARTPHAQREASAWQHASHAALGQSLHKRGWFRHVFAINILSPPHLKNIVDGRTFADWVSVSGHGRLEQWKDKVWVWFVPKDNRIAAATVLQRNGLLTAPSGFENELIG